VVRFLPFVLAWLQPEAAAPADLVVSGDPLSLDPDRLLELKAETTIVDGKVAFRR
jgi:predicted amidohydrolase YtcJ